MSQLRRRSTEGGRRADSISMFILHSELPICIKQALLTEPTGNTLYPCSWAGKRSSRTYVRMIEKKTSEAPVMKQEKTLVQKVTCL